MFVIRVPATLWQGNVALVLLEVSSFTFSSVPSQFAVLDVMCCVVSYVASYVAVPSEYRPPPRQGNVRLNSYCRK